MSREILLVEPKHRSKFPPLGLMRIAKYHKNQGDNVTFIRGCERKIKEKIWTRIYISSLFTYELPKTRKTINYYVNSVKEPEKDILVGGIGVTLLPDYIKNETKCKIITGPLDHKNTLGYQEEPIANLIPDYDLITQVNYKYRPENAYFVRASIGCIRNCQFCAVPILEPNFRFLGGISRQVNTIIENYDEKKDLIILDNNILALSNIFRILSEIEDLGFHRNSKFGRKLRYVDFNQGLDARLITPEIAEALGKINIRPIRLAFDNIKIKEKYENSIRLLVDQGFRYFTTYVMYNFKDDPKEFYDRLKYNIELSNDLDVKITSFPMRFVPIDDINRHHISKRWTWRYLRGIQCILNATHGMVSPKKNFFLLAFGENYEEFIKIITMPDNYIIYRKNFSEQAKKWKKEYEQLSQEEIQELHGIMDLHHHSCEKIKTDNEKITNILRFYKNKGLTDI